MDKPPVDAGMPQHSVPPKPLSRAQRRNAMRKQGMLRHWRSVPLVRDKRTSAGNALHPTVLTMKDEPDVETP